MTSTGRYSIHADRLIVGTGGVVIDNPVLVVEGDTIAAIEQGRATTLAVDHTYEFPGATILPGLIDGHVHLAFSAAESADGLMEEYLGADDLRLAALAAENARRCLAAGITTVRDCGGPGTMIQSLRDAIAAGVTAGPTVYSSGMPITTTAGHCHFFGLRADNEQEVRRAVRQLVQDDVDWVKVMLTGGRLTRHSNILRAQYTPSEARALVEEARRLNRPVAAHVLSVEGIRLGVEAGVTTLEHCNWLDPEGMLRVDEQLIDEIARQGIHVSVTIVGFMRQALLDHLNDPIGNPVPDGLRERHRIEGDMFRRGLNVFVTSDAGVPGCRFDELHLSLAVANAWLGLDCRTALEAVTIRAARALGIEAQVGSLEVGKLADIAVVRGDPTQDLMAVGDVAAVFRGGRLAAQNGAVYPPDGHGVARPPVPRLPRSRWSKT
jgi:imidazolonepropionase-like amidohydrolase